MSNTLEVVGAVGGIVGGVAGIAGAGVAVWAVIVAKRSARASEHANEISEDAGTKADAANALAAEANEISRSAATSSESAAQAADRSAKAAEAHVEIERAARAAQPYVTNARRWTNWRDAASSAVIVELGNSGGSVAQDLTITGAIIEKTTYTITPATVTVAPNDTREVTIYLPIPPPRALWPPFALMVSYSDELGEHTETLPRFYGHPAG